MKILLFADTHLGYDFPIRPRIDRRRRGWDFFNNYQNILDTAISEQVDILLHGGDMFFRSKIPEMIVQRAYEPLLRPLDHGIDILIVPGNHERSNLPVSPLFHHPRLHIFNKPRTFTLTRNGVKVSFGGIPNIRNNIGTSISHLLDETGIFQDSESLKILCLHQAIEAAVVGVQNYRFRKGDDVIGLDQFVPDLDLIVSGHIHRQQILRDHHGTPIIYPGSIERTSFAERLEQKGYYLIEIEPGRLDWQFRTLPTRPMSEIVLSSHIRGKQALLDSVAANIPKLAPDSIIRIKCTSDEQLAVLKIGELRELFPKTCNVDLAVPHRRPGSHKDVN